MASYKDWNQALVSYFTSGVPEILGSFGSGRLPEMKFGQAAEEPLCDRSC